MAKPKTKKIKVVFIQWDDAREADDEEALIDARCIQTTAGLLYESDRWSYSVARDYNPLTKLFEKTIKITKAMVVDFHELEVIKIIL